jgi:hypothetical protein
METRRTVGILVHILVTVGVVLCLGVCAESSASAAAVQITQIGHPIWKPVDFHVFTAPVGTQTNPDFDLTQLMETEMAVLPPPKHQWCDDLGIAPGIPHQPPYDEEIEEGLEDTGFKEGTSFRVAEFSPPNAVWAVWMLVPHPGTIGSSPDFSSGPIIPNTLFPIVVQGQTFHNKKLWDRFLAGGSIPPLTPALTHCPFSVDGHSHIPYFLGDNTSFQTDGSGSVVGGYEFRITMIDHTGSGWHISVYFTVRP